MDIIYSVTGVEIFTAVLFVILCVMVFNVLIRSHKIGKIHKRTMKMSGVPANSINSTQQNYQTI